MAINDLTYRDTSGTSLTDAIAKGIRYEKRLFTITLFLGPKTKK